MIGDVNMFFKEEKEVECEVPRFSDLGNQSEVLILHSL